MKGIQVCSNERPCPFLRGDNYEIAKLHWKNLKIFWWRTTGPISTKLGTMHPLMKGTQVCSNEEPLNSHKVNEFFLLLINILILIICVYRFSRSFLRWALWLMGLLSIYTWPKEIKLRHQNMNWNSLQIGKILWCWRKLLRRGVEGGHLLIILYEIVTFNAKKNSW